MYFFGLVTGSRCAVNSLTWRKTFHIKASAYFLLSLLLIQSILAGIAVGYWLLANLMYRAPFTNKRRMTVPEVNQINYNIYDILNYLFHGICSFGWKDLNQSWTPNDQPFNLGTINSFDTFSLKFSEIWSSQREKRLLRLYNSKIKNSFLIQHVLYILIPHLKQHQDYGARLKFLILVTLVHWQLTFSKVQQN